jgi:hypothetical protein
MCPFLWRKSVPLEEALIETSSISETVIVAANYTEKIKCHSQSVALVRTQFVIAMRRAYLSYNAAKLRVRSTAIANHKI